MRKIIFALAALLFISFPICASSQPRWVANWSADYPESEYLCAVGFGSSSNGADSNAFENLAASFNASVSAVATTHIVEGSVTSSNSENASIQVNDFESQAVVSVKASQIVSAKILERWNDGNGNYASLVVVRRSEAAQFYFEKACSCADIISYYRNIDPSSIPLNSVGIVQSLDDMAIEYYECRNMLAVLSPQLFKRLPSIPSDPEIAMMIDSFMYNLSFSIQAEDDAWYKIEGAVLDALNSLGITPMDEESRYTLIETIDVEETTLMGNPLKFVLYSLVLKVKDSTTGRIVFSWDCSGREGQQTLATAKERAFAVMNKKIKSEFKDKFAKKFGVSID